MPATLAGIDHRRASARIEELLERVGLADLAEKRPNQLSGGERQRVAIARALVLRPSVVLADEPTGNLDSATSRQIIDLLHELHRAGETVVLVTHDIKIAASAERLLVMRDGELSEHEHDQTAEDVVAVIDRLSTPPEPRGLWPSGTASVPHDHRPGGEGVSRRGRRAGADGRRPVC